MVMSDPNTIDIIAESPEGEIVLIISEHRDWGMYSEMREQLRQKVSTYIKFINSDEYRNRFSSKKAKILLTTTNEPSDTIKRDLTNYERDTGVKIEYRTIPL